MARRKELNDKSWAVIKPLLPSPNGRTDFKRRPRRNDQEVLSTALWILRSGACWRICRSKFRHTRLATGVSRSGCALRRNTACREPRPKARVKSPLSSALPMRSRRASTETALMTAITSVKSLLRRVWSPSLRATTTEAGPRPRTLAPCIDPADAGRSNDCSPGFLTPVGWLCALNIMSGTSWAS